MNDRERPRFLLFVIVFSQFAGTSLWFAENAVLPAMRAELGLGDAAAGYVISSVQLGFIAGTLVFAVLGLADRFSSRARMYRGA